MTVVFGAGWLGLRSGDHGPKVGWRVTGDAAAPPSLGLGLQEAHLAAIRRITCQKTCWLPPPGHVAEPLQGGHDEPRPGAAAFRRGAPGPHRDQSSATVARRGSSLTPPPSPSAPMPVVTLTVAALVVGVVTSRKSGFFADAAVWTETGHSVFGPAASEAGAVGLIPGFKWRPGPLAGALCVPFSRPPTRVERASRLYLPGQCPGLELRHPHSAHLFAPAEEACLSPLSRTRTRGGNQQRHTLSLGSSANSPRSAALCTERRSG